MLHHHTKQTSGSQELQIIISTRTSIPTSHQTTASSSAKPISFPTLTTIAREGNLFES
uniref:Uncharacterized protein n=1 Tax=Arundo donax TaxID=35708 RepID=A0A0A9HAC9_ARUDO